VTPLEYAQLDGIALAREIKAGTFTAKDAADTSLAIIDALNPKLNAVTIRAPSISSPSQHATSTLASVPFLLKDANLHSGDMPTTWSSRYLEDSPTLPDSTLVRRWRDAGLVILGKTNTPEFAGEFTTEPGWRGVCRNPWAQNRTTGGSSGGAAAAVASGMVPIAHATDLGGSIRIPSACCGVFGFKPTVGLNPAGPFAELASGLNSDHVITRSVRDSAASLDITRGPDASSRYHVTGKVESYLKALDAPVDALRIGYTVETPDGKTIDSRQSAAVTDTVEVFERLGHRCSQFTWPDDIEIGPWFETLWAVDIAAIVDEHQSRTGRKRSSDDIDPLSEFVLDEIMSASALDSYRARIEAGRIATRLNLAQADFDVLITPALATDPVEIGTIMSTRPFNMESWAEAGYQFSPFTAPFNLTGQPAAACPTSFDETALPCGVQLVGKHRDDHIVLQLSRVLEQHHNWQSRRPPCWAGDL